jgi:putative FmdB family regulatory protein
MPLYDYRCEACGDVFEVKQRICDQPLTVHANCGGRVERLLSPPALQFKGSGWYVTDYARSSKKDESSKPAAKEGSDSKPPKAESTPKKSE